MKKYVIQIVIKYNYVQRIYIYIYLLCALQVKIKYVNKCKSSNGSELCFS